MTHIFHRDGYLLLEDGRVFEGETFFGHEPVLGEVVFNTSHSGYQEILTDPSYCRQIMVFTAPHIGNVGINNEDIESGKIQVAGAVARSFCVKPSNWRSTDGLISWLESSNVAYQTKFPSHWFFYQRALMLFWKIPETILFLFAPIHLL